jgi:hypothetical protein
MGNAWYATTSWDVVCRRAAGRRKYHSIRRLKADLRRIAMARRLNELRADAWRKFDRGGIPGAFRIGLRLAPRPSSRGNSG